MTSSSPSSSSNTTISLPARSGPSRNSRRGPPDQRPTAGRRPGTPPPRGSRPHRPRHACTPNGGHPPSNRNTKLSRRQAHGSIRTITSQRRDPPQESRAVCETVGIERQAATQDARCCDERSSRGAKTVFHGPARQNDLHGVIATGQAGGRGRDRTCDRSGVSRVLSR
jgi:hypothetical protein